MEEFPDEKINRISEGVSFEEVIRKLQSAAEKLKALPPFTNVHFRWLESESGRIVAGEASAKMLLEEIQKLALVESVNDPLYPRAANFFLNEDTK